MLQDQKVDTDEGMLLMKMQEICEEDCKTQKFQTMLKNGGLMGAWKMGSAKKKTLSKKRVNNLLGTMGCVQFAGIS